MSDLISIGVEELVKLSRRYDKNINDSFWGFAKTRVYGSMLDYLRSLDTISRGNRKIIKMVDSAISNYYNEHQTEPTNEELSEIIGEDVDKIKEARLAAEIYQVMPLNEQFSAYEKDTVSDDIEQEELIGVITKILSSLTQREQMIIQLYYFEELSLKEISEILDITQSRISQIHKSVLRKVRDSAGDIFG
jgi:RNA polymerase sigma factor for flagellar operon FliA